MALGRRIGGSGDITPLIKFDARNGIFYRCDRVRERNGQWSTEQKNVTDGLQAVFDLENIEVGWIAFGAGGPPSFVMFPVRSDIGNPPSDKHQQGFRLRLRLDHDNYAREFASTARATWQAVDELHTEYETERNKHPGKLPLVRVTGAKAARTPMGTSYVPMFEIVSWVDRPAELATAPPKVADPVKVIAAATTDLNDKIEF
jgi:hypothetical protein